MLTFIESKLRPKQSVRNSKSFEHFCQNEQKPVDILIHDLVIESLLFCMRTQGNQGFNALLMKVIDEILGVIAFIRQEYFNRNAGNERLSLRHVSGLTRWPQAQGVTQRIG